YSSAIYGALEAVENEEAISFSVLLPLIALTLMLLVGAWLRRRFEARSAPRN
ncbi:MAG: DedA family protein, partial [Halomonas sp.]|nr:DedA family protein [Halomonas sp.]